MPLVGFLFGVLFGVVFGVLFGVLCSGFCVRGSVLFGLGRDYMYNVFVWPAFVGFSFYLPDEPILPFESIFAISDDDARHDDESPWYQAISLLILSGGECSYFPEAWSR